jgi:hypothetical protein
VLSYQAKAYSRGGLCCVVSGYSRSLQSMVSSAVLSTFSAGLVFPLVAAKWLLCLQVLH